MIKAYRIKFLSPYTTIKSYTIFGAFCWAYRLLYGKDRLEIFLKEFSENPKFLISSPFPVIEDIYLFPKPFFELKLSSDIKILEKLKRKPYKNAVYITQKVLEKIIKGEVKNQNDLMKLNVKSGVIYDNDENLSSLNFGKNQIFVHNQINRINNESKNLYFEEGIVPFENQEKYFLVKFIDESFINEFEKILKIVQELGLGGNKNIGWGKVEILEDYKNFSFLERKEMDKFITLSPIIPKNIDLKNSYYNFYTFVSYTDGSFEKPKLKGKIDYIEEGSIIKKQDTKQFAGVLKHISNDIYQYGLEFPVYMEW